MTHRRRASSTYLGPMPNVTIDEVEYRRLTDDRAYLTRRVHELTDEVDALKDALRRAKASSNAVTHGRRAPRSRSRTPPRPPRHSTSDLGSPRASVPSQPRSASRWTGVDHGTRTPRYEVLTRIGAVAASGGSRYSYRHTGGEMPSRPGDGIGNDSETETDTGNVTDNDARSLAAESFATTKSEAKRWARRDTERASTAAGRLMYDRYAHLHGGKGDDRNKHDYKHDTAAASQAPTPWSSASRLDAAERMALLQAEIESLRVAMEAPYSNSKERGGMNRGSVTENVTDDVAANLELSFDDATPLPPHPWKGLGGAERVYAASLTNSRSDQSTGSAASTPTTRGERSGGGTHRRRGHRRSSSRESLGSPARPRRTSEDVTWDVNVDDVL